ncbi:NAD(P)-dependent dehydrogenase, short-chain alcohol dehydrogenase family [Pseudonocardia thermophila]|jgi:Dehydrogenases with different specificities (related to short-chain alcohol dehydrogenases)|uniref:NAD(P)-dependent dehydrogenase, short-chain alcohol dehydrogenase family n=1 Tax=Pseudonocardia thermophila TaxID=1848 RepID=A0A1M6RL95_PSETH|nr:glucose 1-dehydrogenase [Pseudonocardia thermophila]SHK33222.1 NAD(P)-dependent dehydrogenase, short-chain alcohol dehydrogenase family [Pseudonocardia thermophila]
MGRVDGKIALVTGGANGIGRETAITLAREGAMVVIADIDIDGAKRVAEGIGAAATAEWFDATDQASVEALVASVIDAHGRIDVIHNNAALVGPDAWFTDGTVIDTSVEMWDRAFATNVRSIFLMCKYALPHMIEGGGGSIINMASIAGLRGGTALTAYGSTKAAVIGLTRFVAAQYGKQGVRCNAIAPGLIQTQQLLDSVPDLPRRALAAVASPRVGLPSDIANMVLFLASDESAFVNGEVYRVDGGEMAAGSSRRGQAADDEGGRGS